MRTFAATLVALVLAACSGAPNLDEAAPGMTTDAIRSAVADHLSWGEKLTAQQLDDVATFIAEYAGDAAGTPPANDPGLTVWRANDCGSCHTLAAGEGSGS
jgi:hypothetical protein